MENKLSHFDENGNAVMVDVSDKPVTHRTAVADGKTGVEMEALTGVQVTLLTIYDMCKAIDKHMVMTDIHLVEKTGGKSGDFVFERRMNT